MLDTTALDHTNPLDQPDTRTPRQLAGAANGRLAAGAKSPEGLARSAANATKHGLTSKASGKSSEKSSEKASGKSSEQARHIPAVVLLNESPDAYDALFQSLAACLQPGDRHELMLVRRMAESEWLRQRALQMESAAMGEAMRQQARAFAENANTATLEPNDREPLRAWHAFSKLSASNPAFAALQRYAATHARAYSRAERELRDYRIAKAESIHPTPEPLEQLPTLEPVHDPQARWQPLETVQPADKETQENTPAQSPKNPMEETIDETIDETKVTPQEATLLAEPPLATPEPIIVFSIEN